MLKPNIYYCILLSKTFQEETYMNKQLFCYSGEMRGIVDLSTCRFHLTPQTLAYFISILLRCYQLRETGENGRIIGI